jgi:hypothetical protein
MSSRSRRAYRQMDSLTANEVLAVLKDLWLTGAFFSSRGHRLLQTFLRKVKDDPQQKKQVDGLIRFCKRAVFGPALSTSRKRLRAALFLNEWKLRRKIPEDPPEDPEFFEDLAIAIRFRKAQRVDAYLAKYSVLMAGREPLLTFKELQEILGMKRRTLGDKIKALRESYGELAVPLRPGRRGRPRKISRG